jgi:hypothetical protein
LAAITEAFTPEKKHYLRRLLLEKIDTSPFQLSEEIRALKSAVAKIEEKPEPGKGKPVGKKKPHR